MTPTSETEDMPRPTSAEANGTARSNMHELVPVRPAGVPVPIVAKRVPNRTWWFRIALAVAVLAGGVGGGAYYWWQRLHPPLPPGIYFGNGRLEADEINIDTKYAARIAEILVDEGDLVKAGQVVARMDTRDLACLAEKIRSSSEPGTQSGRRSERQCGPAENPAGPGKAGIRSRDIFGAKRFPDPGGRGSAATTT